MKILLVRLDHMGDVVLTVPPIAASIRSGIPDICINVLTTSAGKVLLQDDPNIDRIMVFDPPWSVPPTGYRSTPKWNYFQRCMKFLIMQFRGYLPYFDYIFYLSFSPWERLLTAWKAKQRVGFSGPYKRWAFQYSCRLLTHSITFHTNQHILENCLNLLNPVFPKTVRYTETVLKISEKRRDFGRFCLKKILRNASPVVLFHAGTHYSMKAWPFLNYCQIAESLCKEFETSCVFIGSPSEISIQREYCRIAGIKYPLLLETPTVNDLLCVVANADIFIANDGGPMHIASAIGVPTLAVFGPTDECIYGPRGKRSHVVREPGICSRRNYPWYNLYCCYKAEKECLKLIQVETVLETVRNMMKTYGLHRVKGN